MNILKKLVLIFFSLLYLNGCISANIPPQGYEAWKQDGKTETDIKKVLLDCGYRDVYHDPWDKGLNTFIPLYECVKSQGYIFYLKSDICAANNYKPQICREKFTIPTPSVERRLNSQYCKYGNNRYLPECQP